MSKPSLRRHKSSSVQTLRLAVTGLLGGLTDSDSDASSEGAEIEDQEEASSAHVAALSNSATDVAEDAG